MKTIQDAQKEHRKPRNQREIQPQKMIQGKVAAEQFNHMKTLKISKDPLKSQQNCPPISGASAFVIASALTRSDIQIPKVSLEQN